MKTLARLLIAAAALPAWLVLGATPAAAAGTTYYVDAAAGSDGNAGTSQSAPWQSLAKVDATTFAPGDRVLFHAGETWAGQLHPLGSGAPGSPITLAGYGTGAPPHIDGGSLAGGGAIYLTGQSYWTVNGFEVTNDSGTDNFGTPTAGVYRSGIYVDDGSLGLVSGITITNNFVHDVNGCFACTNGDGHGNGGIVVIAYYPVFGQSYDGVLIQGNRVDHVGREGISFFDFSTLTAEPFQQGDLQSSMSTRLVIRGNTVTYTDADGITDVGTEGSVIEGNVVGHSSQKRIVGDGEASSGGIWNAHTIDTTEQYNEVYGTLTQSTDGTAFDNDLGTRDTKIQYNYSHDNEGGFLLMEGTGFNQPPPDEGLIVRYNLSVNDAYSGVKGVFDFAYGGSNDTLIANNTVYVPAGSVANLMTCNDCNGTEAYGAWTFRNNIVENFGSGGYYYYPPAPGAPGPTFDHNLFFGNHPATEPAEPDKITADPLLVAPGATAPLGICAVGGYGVAAGSPAIGRGLADGENGGHDFFGSTLSAAAAPTLGFDEASVFPGRPLLIDGANSFITSARHSLNTVLDTTPGVLYGGDASRISRGDQLPATVTWLYDGMQTFSATVYRFPADPSVLTFWTSPDGVNFTQVATTGTTTVTPLQKLPARTRYLMARISTPGIDPDLSFGSYIGLTTSGVPPQETGPLPNTLEIGALTITGSGGGCA